MKFAITLAFVACLMVSATDALVNGVGSPHKPYYARITYRQLSGNQATVFQMAGSIISDRAILTSAFAFGNSFDFNVYVGSNQRAEQTPIRGLALLGLSTLPEGPALVTLATPIQFTQFLRPIRMVQADGKIGTVNEQGMVLGMGGLTPVTRASLHAAFMRITPTTVCQTNYPTQNMDASFCAFDVDQRSDFCAEDRGTGLTVLSRDEEVLVGIAVEGICSLTPQNRPSLFVRISHFRTRITEILDGLQITLQD